MFNELDRKIINRDCFKIILMGDSLAEIESENGDHWIILEEQEHLNKGQIRSGRVPAISYKLLHRHADAKSFHLHTACLSVLDIVLEVLQHDDYRLKKRGRTHFDELLEEVGIT